MKIYVPMERIGIAVQTLLHNRAMSHEEKARTATNVIIDELNQSFEPIHHGDPEHPEYIQPLPEGKLPHHRWTWRMKQRLMRVWNLIVGEDWYA